MIFLSILQALAVALPLPQQSQSPNQIRGQGKGLDKAQARAGDEVKIVENIIQPSTTGDSTFLQFRVAMPLNATGEQGINVLLHGDGGQSFFEFPNADPKIQNNLIGVAVLAPNKEMRWGGTTLDRTDGPQHAQLLSDLITDVLPQMVNFNPDKVYFTGVSGGSLTLTSAMIPMFGDRFNSGYMIMCGGLPPPNGLAPEKLPNRIHFQTTTDELSSLKPLIPQAIQSVQQAAQDSGLSTDDIAARFTIDGTPQGGHCAFDGKGFNSGIQKMANNFAKVMFNNQGIAGVTAKTLASIADTPDPFSSSNSNSNN